MLRKGQHRPYKAKLCLLTKTEICYLDNRIVSAHTREQNVGRFCVYVVSTGQSLRANELPVLTSPTSPKLMQLVMIVSTIAVMSI